jgi:hypothetical protein
MQISVKIRGVTALLMNRFTEASEVSVSGGTSTTLRGDRGMPREQAALKRYCDEDGRLFIPGPNIFSAIVQAGAFHKAGKSKLTTMKSSLVPAGLSVSDLICPLLDDAGKPLKAWEVDSRSVVIPSTGGRIMCHRPRIDHWFCQINVEIDESVFAPKLIRALFDDAGKKIGLGDYRPARKGPFGRFVVDQWREELAALAA